MNAIKNFISDEAGVSAVEYALMAAAIAAVVGVAANALGVKIGAALDFVTGRIRTS